MDGYSWIALLTLIITVLGVWGIRKRKEYTYSLLDTSGVILNAVLIVMIYPPLALVCGFLGAGEFATNPNTTLMPIVETMGRLMPALSVAGIGASVILRRKEHPVPSFWIQFTGAVWFGIIILLAKSGGIC